MNISCAPQTNDGIQNLRNDCGDDYPEETKLYAFDDQSTGLAALGLVELAQKSPHSDGEMQNIKGRKQIDMPSNFLAKLMDILNRSHYPRVISWTTDGQSICVNNSRGVVEPILRLHFTALKYDIFIRKLRRCGFIKIGTVTNHDLFHNRFFQRGEPILCNKVGRFNEMSFPDFSANANSVESNLDFMLKNESVASNFHNSNIFTADYNKLLHHSNLEVSHIQEGGNELLRPIHPNLDVPNIQEDGTQFLNAVPIISFNYLSRRLNNSNMHKKIIGDALQCLLTENVRQDDCNIGLQSDLTHEHAIGISNMNNIDLSRRYSSLELLSALQGCR